jgi:hypothetical protein
MTCTCSHWLYIFLSHLECSDSPFLQRQSPSPPPHLPEQPQNRRNTINMQKRTEPNIPPHHIIIPTKIQKNLWPHDHVTRIYVAQIPERNYAEIPFRHVCIARDNSAQDRDAAEEQEDVGERVGEDQGGGRDRCDGRCGGCRELARDEG